ncbi:MAG: hypothetical protein ACXVCY_08875 [Pseudobdellovibrionaceae bacterium]
MRELFLFPSHSNPIGRPTTRYKTLHSPPGEVSELPFGGALVESSMSGGFLKLIKALNAGESCFVDSFLKKADKKKDFCSLQTLADAGAFDKS